MTFVLWSNFISFRRGVTSLAHMFEYCERVYGEKFARIRSNVVAMGAQIYVCAWTNIGFAT